MNFHSYGESSTQSVRIITGQSVLIDPSSRPKGTCLEVESGIARVYCPCEETEGMTLAFLQSGDQLRTDRLCSEGVCVEALTDLSFHSNAEISDNSGFDAVNEWTLQLLRIRHLGNAEQRLQALFAILVVVTEPSVNSLVPTIPPTWTILALPSSFFINSLPS